MIITATIPADDVPVMWPIVRRWIKEACAWTLGVVKPADIRSDCMAGRRHMFVIMLGESIIGSGVLEIDQTSVHVTSLGGSRLPHGWEPHLLDYLVSVALSCRLRTITIQGRRGWDRKLRPLGFVREGELLVKRI
jgi:hypothetical protein